MGLGTRLIISLSNYQPHTQDSLGFHSPSLVSSPLADDILDGPAVDAPSVRCLNDSASPSLLRFLGGGPGSA